MFIQGLEADVWCRAEEEGTEVEGATKAAGWDIGNVVFDDAVEYLDEGGDGIFLAL